MRGSRTCSVVALSDLSFRRSRRFSLFEISRRGLTAEPEREWWEGGKLPRLMRFSNLWIGRRGGGGGKRGKERANIMHTHFTIKR